MPDLPSPESIAAIYYLLPGFLAAGLFHLLTVHDKSSPFERVIAALIFTVLVQFVTTLLGWFFSVFGQYIYTLGEWTKGVEQVWSVIVAMFVGIGIAWAANNDFPLSWFRTIGVTARTSHPSEAYTAFVKDARYLILHLKGGRRLHGWPFLWPDHYGIGHFIILEPQWLLHDNSFAPLHSVEYMLICSADVEMIEFMKNETEVKVDIAELKRVEKLLVDLQMEDLNEADPKECSEISNGFAGSRDDWKTSQESTDFPA